MSPVSSVSISCIELYFLLSFCHLISTIPRANAQELGEAAAISAPPDEGGLQCPTWTHRNGTDPHLACECAPKVDAIVICDPATKTAFMHLGYCMSYIEESNMTVFGTCIYNSYQVYSDGLGANMSTLFQDTHAYYPLPRNKSKLGTSCRYLNRRGLLCGKCLDGFVPPLLSYDLKCMNCSGASRIKNWAVLCARMFVPITVFYVVALTFRLSLLSPRLNGFILFAQYVSSPPLVRQVVLLVGGEPITTTPVGKNFIYAIISLYSWCNLDFFGLFFPPICDPRFDSTFSVFAINYISILYPLLLVALTYLFVELRDRGYRLVRWLQRPFHKLFFLLRRNCNVHCSCIEVFASFLFISYVRFLSVSLDTITAVRLSNIENKQFGSFFWLYDASLEIFGKTSIPVLIPSFLVILCVIFLPTLLLCGCSTRHTQLLCKKVCRRRSFFLGLHTFMDAFQGCYKDGTKPGTYNCRFVAPLNLFMRLCFYLAYTVILGHHYHLFTISLTLVYAIFISLLRPYKSQYAVYNIVDPLFIMLFCLLQVASFGIILFRTERRNWLPAAYIIAQVIAVIPLFYVAGLFLYWLSKTKLVQRVRERVTSKGSNMDRTIERNDVDDDEEIFNTYIMGQSYGSIEQNKKMAARGGM